MSTPLPIASAFNYSPGDQLAYLRLVFDEGKKYIPYLDTENNWTVGIGHLILPAEHDTLFPAITDEVCHALFEQDWLRAVALAKALPYYASLNDARQRIQSCLIFNMGPIRWAGFHDTERDLTIGAYPAAAAALLASKWRTQVKENRAQTYARIIQTGVWESPPMASAMS